MSRPRLIQLTLESMADWDVDIADIIEPYINKLEQENIDLSTMIQELRESNRLLTDYLMQE